MKYEIFKIAKKSIFWSENERKTSEIFRKKYFSPKET
jgi:hypothetical protein